MRLSELITAVRHRVNDTGSKYHTDKDIVFWINRHARAITRKRVEADTSYANQKLDILASNTRMVEQIDNETYRYYLPSWVYRVRRIAQLSGNDILRDLQRTEWGFSSNRSIDIRTKSALDIRILAAKVPTLLRPVVVASNSASTSELRVAVDGGAGYTFETEEGCMLGAQFEVTTVVSGRDPRGGPSVVTSQQLQVIGSIPTWVMTVKPAFPALPVAADTMEMHCEIEDIHLTYLIELVAHDLFQRVQNVSAMQLCRPQLEKLERQFAVGLQPRTDGMLTTMNQGEEYLVDDDPNVDPYWYGWR